MVLFVWSKIVLKLLLHGKKAVMAGDDNQLSLKVLEWILYEIH
jgi:hypothetical protein